MAALQILSSVDEPCHCNEYFNIFALNLERSDYKSADGRLCIALIHTATESVMLSSIM